MWVSVPAEGVPSPPCSRGGFKYWLCQLEGEEAGNEMTSIWNGIYVVFQVVLFLMTS